MESVFHRTKNRLSNAVGRWAGIGPYYAMFPLSFAFDVVEHCCPKGGAVLDPFAGRASSLFAAAVTGRQGYGIEINKVGWLYGKSKLSPAPVESVLARNSNVGQRAADVSEEELHRLPAFFHSCYTKPVLKYLLAARAILDWQFDETDSTLMALILVYLHGTKEKSLSNQMRQSKSMAPEYSLRWWLEHNSSPPDVDPLQFMEQRIYWRYRYGRPSIEKHCLLLGDSTILLSQFAELQQENSVPKLDLLLTSPPYYNITSYHYDQWLRLWMLGGPEVPTKSGGSWQNGFWSQASYYDLLTNVFTQSAQLLKPNAMVYVRTDVREFTFNTTLTILKHVFSFKRIHIQESPLKKKNQTALFGDKSQKPGEVDVILY